MAKIHPEKEEAIIKELCTSNGIQHALLEGNGPAIKILEMFFSGYPQMVGLDNFPNLTVLILIGQTINQIEGVQFCPELKELWVCECNLKRIHGLEENKKLNKLFLYRNQIRKIENLSHLTLLEVLNLSKNELDSMQGAGALKSLKFLDVAGNNLSSIGNTIDSLIQLTTLNVAGNLLSSFKELTNLVRLPALKDLILKDPLYRNNPVCLLCNYSTHILYHLTNLEKLDAFDVSSLQMRDLAETTVMKKKMYYHMRIKTVRRNLMSIINRLNREKKSLLQVPEEKLKLLFFSLKSIRQQQECFGSDQDMDVLSEHLGKTVISEQVNLPDGISFEELDNHSQISEQGDFEPKAKKLEDKHYKQKLEMLKNRIKAWNKRIEEIEAYYKQASDHLNEVTNASIRHLTIELESGGNVRFERGSNTKGEWYKTCHDLMLSRFCAWDYKSYDIKGLKILGITRIHNRVLRNRFDDRVHSSAVDENGLPSNKTYKKLVDYLFFVWNPKSLSAKHGFHKIIEDGFAGLPISEDQDEGIPLSNSLFLCDKPRMDHLCQQAKEDSYADSLPFRYGTVVVCKVYLGKSTSVQGNSRILIDIYNKVDSVYRPRKESIYSTSTSTAKAAEDCECSGRQYEWRIFDSRLVLPEYIIDFEYLTDKNPKSPFRLHLGEWMRTGLPGPTTLTTNSDSTGRYESEETSDKDALNMLPKIKARPRLVALSEEILLKLGRGLSLNQITILNLHGNGLGRLKGIASLSQLKSLVVSFNELTRLDDIAYMVQLETVDASFNKINSLEGMRGMSKIRELDLSWNQLSSLRDDLAVLRKHSPTLTKLDLRKNPWIKADYLFLRVIGRLKSLTMLNDTPVTETDAAAALRLVSGTRLSQTSLGIHSRNDTEAPKTLNLRSTAQILDAISKLKPDLKDPTWATKVTSLNLDGQFIGKLVGLERLVNLRWATFDRNCITKLEGVEHCKALEELSLQDNCIYKLDGLSYLTKLQRLDLTSNYLSSLEGIGFDNLKSLQYLSVENNRISALKGLTNVTSLVELFIGNNRLSNLREIFHIKTLHSLVILDLFGNPLVQSDNYRLFVVYHLQNLKALDGNAVETIEENSAKDTFGGRLSNDFIAERIRHSNFHEVRELDFPSCSIRSVDLGNGDLFRNLRSVNLEHNNLTSFSGLIHLRFLRVLCLNHNHVDCIIPRPKNQKPQLRSQYAFNNTNTSDIYAMENLPPVMENLEVLHLGYNKINNMGALQLGRLINLKALFMQGNEIAKIEGLEGLHELREFVLDRNKVKLINENSFVSQWNMQELHLEENRLRDLSNLHHLENLQRLYLGMNRIQDMIELEKLESLPNLIEISMIGNAVSRRLLHRPMLVFQLPNLQTIDGIPVTPEERTKAELYFLDQRPMVPDTILPGITPFNRAGPIKVTHMSIGSDRYMQSQHYDDNEPGKVKRTLGRDKSHHHSMMHGALCNQIASAKYQANNNNRSLGSGNR